MHLGRRCSAHHYRQTQSGTFHLRRHVHHFFQARRDQSAQTYHVCLLRHGFLHNLLGRNHYAKVHNVVVVARHHHRHDVLADVMYVALDGCHQHLAGCGRSLLLVSFDVGLQYCHRLLHRAGGLHHLREEHLAATEQLAHRVHAVHERAFYDVHGLREGGQGFLNVFLHIFRHTLHQRCGQALCHVLLAPFGLCLAYRCCASSRCAVLQRFLLLLYLVSQLYKAFCCVRPAVEHHVLQYL